MGYILRMGCPIANEVAILVLARGAHHHGSLLGCLLLLLLGQLLQLLFLLSFLGLPFLVVTVGVQGTNSFLKIMT